MSTKSTIYLTHDNEHCYDDCVDYIKDKNNKLHNKITIEFDKRNIEIVCNDESDLIIEITNPDSDLYKLFNNLSKFGYQYLKENDLI